MADTKQTDPIRITVLGKEYELPDNSLQSIFNHVVTRLGEQAAKSIDNGRCAYRSVDRCCAAGWLIDDSQWDSVWNSESLSDIFAMAAVRRSLLRPDDHQLKDFLRILQHTHDSDSIERWYLCFRRIAEGWLLNTKALNAAFPEGQPIGAKV